MCMCLRAMLLATFGFIHMITVFAYLWCCAFVVVVVVLAAVVAFVCCMVSCVCVCVCMIMCECV